MRAQRNSSIQSKFSVANRRAMKSLISCQNEDSRGLSSASRLTALSSSSRAARCAARFVSTGVRKSRILSSAVSCLFASNSDNRARTRKASMHVSRRVLMTRLNDTYSICPEIFSHKNLRMLPSLHRILPVCGSAFARSVECGASASLHQPRREASAIIYATGPENRCRNPELIGRPPSMKMQWLTRHGEKPKS